MVARLDRDVGLVLDELKAQGVERDTLVIFSSDNGPAVEGRHTPDFFGSRGPLRGEKGSLYEGGIRVPSIARWPGRIQPGQVSSRVWAFWDFLPTAAELAGVPCPEGIDGVSFSGALFGKGPVSRPCLYWEQGRDVFQQAVRLGNWKGLRLKGHRGPSELYRLDEDPGESRDLSGKYPEVVGEIEALMRASHSESADFPSR
jgi:arylsulfatase A-like enzyme